MSTNKTHVIRYDLPSARQYQIIRDNSVTVIELEAAALLGWRLRSITRQGEADWVGMTADEILEFKRRVDTLTIVTNRNEIDAVLATEAKAP